MGNQIPCPSSLTKSCPLPSLPLPFSRPATCAATRSWRSSTAARPCLASSTSSPSRLASVSRATSPSRRTSSSDVPAGLFASLEAVPTAGWLQIMVLTCMQEAGTGFASKPQDPDGEAGDIALDSWVRYDDPEVKTFKLNAERQNGRAAMLGITGCL